MLAVLRNKHPWKGNAMNDFITKFQNELAGTLSGFDRLAFRGTLWRNRLSGMKGYLWAHGLGLKDFKEHAEQVSQRVKEAAVEPMLAAGRPVRRSPSAVLSGCGLIRCTSRIF